MSAIAEAQVLTSPSGKCFRILCGLFAVSSTLITSVVQKVLCQAYSDY